MLLVDNAPPWHALGALAFLGVLLLSVVLLQVSPFTAAVVLAVGFLSLGLLFPEGGFVILLGLVAADIYIEPSGGTAFFGSQILVLALFAGSLLRFAQGRSRLPRTWFDFGVLLFLSLAGLSIFPAASKSDALKVFLKLCTFVMAFFIVRSMQLSPLFLRRALTVITATVVLTGLYGVYQFLAPGPIPAVEQTLNLHVTESTLGGDAVRSYSTFRYALEFGTFLIVVGSIVIARCLLETRPIHRLLYGAAAAAGVAGLLASFSRAATAGLVLSFVLQLKVSRVKFRTIAAFAIPLVLVGVLFMNSEDVVFARASSVAQVESLSYLGRLARWNVGMEVIKSHPLLGVGLGNLPSHLPLAYETGQALEIPNLENLFLTYAAQIGVPGAVVLMVLLLAGMVIGLRVYRSSQPSIARVFGLGIAGAIIAILVNGLTDPVLVGGQNSVLVFLILGVAVGLYEQSKRGSMVRSV